MYNIRNIGRRLVSNILDIVFLCALIALPGAAQQSTAPDVTVRSLNVQLANPPTPLQSCNVQSTNNPGPQRYFYWVVASSGVGDSAVFGPCAGDRSFSNKQDNATNFATINVTPPGPNAGGFTYSYLRTTTNAVPTGACGCGIAVSTTSSSLNDNVADASLLAYTVNTFNGTGAAPLADRSSWAQLGAVMNDGNGNEMNEHGSTGNATQTMTAAQLITEEVTAMKQLEQQGYPNAPFKAAYAQNLANNSSAILPYVWAQSTSSSAANNPVQCWPPINRKDVGRYALHGHIASDFTTAFNLILQTHGWGNWYFHRVDPSDPNSITPAQWGLLLDLLNSCLRAGTCEVVTFQQLMARDGYKYQRGLGRWTSLVPPVGGGTPAPTVYP